MTFQQAGALRAGKTVPDAADTESDMKTTIFTIDRAPPFLELH
jgi:hypothetical protein